MHKLFLLSGLIWACSIISFFGASFLFRAPSNGFYTDSQSLVMLASVIIGVFSFLFLAATVIKLFGRRIIQFLFSKKFIISFIVILVLGCISVLVYDYQKLANRSSTPIISTPVSSDASAGASLTENIGASPIVPVVTTIQAKKIIQNTQKAVDWSCEVLDDKTTACAHPADSRMSTSEELFVAVNEYRKAHGIGTLEKNDLLCSIAQNRANEQLSYGSLDSHAGFEKYARNQTDFDAMGEILYGGVQNQLGVHIVEWGWARSQTGHKESLEDRKWQNGCGGVAGLFAVFIFGKR